MSFQLQVISKFIYKKKNEINVGEPCRKYIYNKGKRNMLLHTYIFHVLTIRIYKKHVQIWGVVGWKHYYGNLNHLSNIVGHSRARSYGEVYDLGQWKWYWQVQKKILFIQFSNLKTSSCWERYFSEHYCEKLLEHFIISIVIICVISEIYWLKVKDWKKLKWIPWKLDIKRKQSPTFNRYIHKT